MRRGHPGSSVRTPTRFRGSDEGTPEIQPARPAVHGCAEDGYIEEGGGFLEDIRVQNAVRKGRPRLKRRRLENGIDADVKPEPPIRGRKTGRSFGGEMLGIALICLAVLGFMGEYSGLLGLDTGAGGSAGQVISRALNLGFGRVSPLLLLGMAISGLCLIIRGKDLFSPLRSAGIAVLVVTLTAGIHAVTVSPGMEIGAGTRGFGGGVIGALACLALRRIFGAVGLWVVLVASAMAGVILVSGWSLTDLSVGSGTFMGRGASAVGAVVARGVHRAKRTFGRGASRGQSPTGGYKPENASAVRTGFGEGLPASALQGTPAARSDEKRERSDEKGDRIPAGAASWGGSGTCQRGLPSEGSTAIPVTDRMRQAQVGAENGGVKGTGGEGRTGTGWDEPGKAPRAQSRREADRGPGEERHPAREEGRGYIQITLGPEILYELPPTTLLSGGLSSESEKKRRRKDDKSLMARANLLVETLANFGVNVTLTDVKVGPAVTRFEVHPAKGVKVSQVSRLADDIALALAAPEIRVEAPIPGKSAIGIEVPNLETSLVRLRDVIESKAFAGLKSPLRLALGKDIAGNSVVAGLDRMLHLLIAGATGSGKSVCINAIITSLLVATKPDEVKFLLIDPKVVELSVYNGIPHLISPVVTAPKKAASALRWVVNEMMRRYETFGETGVRDITGYNEWARNAGPEKGKRLPYIVVVIDELSDLMMVSPVEVEDCIFRLAQMARAAGIHLVVATQRPSTDVITGTIKANIPSRIAFAVSSHVDSKTILDMVGAEKLIGGGDMLFLPVWATKPLRVQGAYVSDREVERVVAFASRQCRPQFEADVTSTQEEEAGSSVDDELFRKALAIVVEQGQASVSLLQRKLRIGYSRAGRLIDAMEERGYVGAYEGSKPRDVKITWEEYERLFGSKAQLCTERAEGRTGAGVEPRAESVPPQRNEGD